MNKSKSKSKNKNKNKVNTLVISAFPACGKTYFYNKTQNGQSDYTSLDSDSSSFSWIKDSNGNNTTERNPNFPQNYIEYIKENIGSVDIIFVSSHLEVRKAMTENNIEFITVYPEDDMLNEWIGRMFTRGNDSNFINFIIDNWDKFMYEAFMNDCSENDFFGYELIRLETNEYIDECFIDSIMTDRSLRL